MKAIFSSISRLFFAYSKFIVMLLMLSTLNTITVNSSETIYLKCNNNYYGIEDIYLESNYNIRSKKIKITQYKNKRIYKKGYKYEFELIGNTLHPSDLAVSLYDSSGGSIGYNYGSSEWYKRSYKVFNKKYKPKKKYNKKIK